MINLRYRVSLRENNSTKIIGGIVAKNKRLINNDPIPLRANNVAKNLYLHPIDLNENNSYDSNFLVTYGFFKHRRNSNL